MSYSTLETEGFVVIVVAVFFIFVLSSLWFGNETFLEGLGHERLGSEEGMPGGD